MLGKSRSEAFTSLEQYGRLMVGLLAVIALGILILVARPGMPAR